MPATIPIFPLGAVLLPGLPLPLHIFETRYRQLLADLAARQDRGGFGIVALSRGTETSTDVEFAEVGTLAEIVQRRPYPDGSCDLLTVGSRRFRIRSLDAEGRPYLQAGVDWLDERDGPLSEELLASTRLAYEDYLALLERLAGMLQHEPLSADPVRTSYEIAGRLPLAVRERQALLAAQTVAHRLAAERALLRRESVLLRQTGTAPVDLKALRLIPGNS